MKSEQYIAMREHYESEIANSVLKNPDVTPAVKKVSKAIVELIDSNIGISIDLTKECVAIEEEIHHPDYFGRINVNKNTCNTPIKTLQDLRAILVDDHSPLELVMHVHAVFMGKVYDRLPNKIPSSLLSSRATVVDKPSYSQQIAEKIRKHPNKIKEIKFEVVKKIFFNELFFKSDKLDRSRQLKTDEVKRSTLIGISRSEFFMNLAEKSDYEHLRAADRFIADPNSNYTQQAIKHNLPLVAGPSGNAGGLILTAIMCGDVSQEEMKQYGLATIAYLEGGGNHAFHEIGSVLTLVDIPHKLGEYEPSLPDSYKNSAAYQRVKQEFSKLLKDHIQQKQISDSTYYGTEYKTLYQQFTGNSLQLDPDIKNNGTCVYSWKKFDTIGAQSDEKKAQKTCNIKKTSSASGLNQLSYLYTSTTSTFHTQQQSMLPSSSDDVSVTLRPINALLDLCLFGAAKLGIYEYQPQPNAKVELKHQSEKYVADSREYSVNQILLRDTGKSLDETLHILCGKYAARHPAQTELIKNLLIDITNKKVSSEIGEQYNVISQYQSLHMRWKALLKLAKKHCGETDQYDFVAQFTR